MGTKVTTPSPSGQREHLIPGCNALETSLVLGQSWTRGGKPYMLIDIVKRVLRTLDEQNIPYAVIGGLAVSHHAVPRLTQDVDLIIAAEDRGRFRAIFQDYYQRGTAINEVYIEGTRVDVLPAKLRYQRAVVKNAISGQIQDTPARIASLRYIFSATPSGAGRKNKKDSTATEQLIRRASAPPNRPEEEEVGTPGAP
jgi:hypothetical protein